ncbi:MAG: C39 family peptidase, partial [Thermodesulfobacteriota bacterium]
SIEPVGAVFIDAVPFYKQDKQMCGPSAVTSVMNYYGSAVDLKEVTEAVYTGKLKGTLPIDIVIYAKEKSFDASYYEGGLDDLKKNLRQKTPLILFVDLGYFNYKAGHYIVVLGYSDALGVIVAHWGVEREKVVDYEYLLKIWQRTGYSTILLTPKGRFDAEVELP